MSDRIGIALLMCVFNTPEDWIRQALESAVAQHFRGKYRERVDFRIFVVDDGSDDAGDATLSAAFAAAKSAPREGMISMSHRLENGGVGVASNFGVRLILEKFPEAKYLARLDADDILQPAILDLELHVLEGDPQTDAVSGGMLYMTAEGTHFHSVFHPAFRREGVERIGYMTHSGSMMRMDLMRAAGGYPEGLKKGTDWYFWKTAAEECGARFSGIGMSVIRRRIHAGSTSYRGGSRHVRRMLKIGQERTGGK